MGSKRVKRGTADPPVSDRSAVLSDITRSISGIKLWADVEGPMILRTGITSLNRGMRTGGIPGGMLGVVHGPSQGGKTVFVSEVLRSVEATGGLALFADAECRGVDLKWFKAICGDLKCILYYKPKTFEEFICRVQDFRTSFRKAKNSGALPEAAMLGIGVDSLNRLCPRDELEILIKGKTEGRKYPLRAMLIASWLDSLIPTLERDEVVVAVLREGENLDAMPGQKKYRVKGGKAPIYDGGWVCRITATSKVKIRKKGDNEKDLVIGEKHEVLVLKNSMGSKGAITYFYTSIGAKTGTPLGLDAPREVRDELIERGFAKHRAVKGATGYYIGDDFVAADKPKLLAYLLEEEDGLARFRGFADVLDVDSTRTPEDGGEESGEESGEDPTAGGGEDGESSDD